MLINLVALFMPCYGTEHCGKTDDSTFKNEPANKPAVAPSSTPVPKEAAPAPDAAKSNATSAKRFHMDECDQYRIGGMTFCR